jgi:flagellar biosynthesis/type III secretory pathway protein FliH
VCSCFYPDLIRHGKNAQPSSAPAPAQPTNASTSGHHSRQQQEYAQAQHQQAQQQQQAGYGGGGVQGYSGQNRQQGQAMNDNLQGAFLVRVEREEVHHPDNLMG